MLFGKCVGGSSVEKQPLRLRLSIAQISWQNLARLATGLTIAGFATPIAAMDLAQVLPTSPNPIPTVRPATPAVPADPQPDAQPSPPAPVNVQPKPPDEKKEPRNQPDEFPPNPLEINTPDPLLPRPPIDRPLSPLERRNLEAALDQLNLQAQAQLQAGNPVAAFEIWNRELRLRRALGPLQETQALARVGEAAWNENQPYQVQIITGRLQQIQQAAQTSKPPNLQVLEAVALAYQKVRSPGLAINVYEQLLADARQRKDAARVQTILQTMGQLHLTWFDYPKAAAVYQELLATAKTSGNRANEIVYLNQLAYIYEQSKQHEQAIAVEQQLIDLHQKAKNPEPIPALKLRIADNYQALKQIDLAEQNYQAAFTLAQPLFQLSYASEALQKLGVLYKGVDRLDLALKVYGYLVTVEQQTYNYFGMMSAFDEIGKIYLSQKAYPQAITAFQKGLQLAQQIKYREDYFNNQLQVAQRGGVPVNQPPTETNSGCLLSATYCQILQLGQ
jgi:tetratricopeptide (TPR) repeat protein